MEIKRLNLNLSGSDFATVMKALSDYVDIVDSPLMDSPAISEDELRILRKIIIRMFTTLDKNRRNQRKGCEA